MLGETVLPSKGTVPFLPTIADQAARRCPSGARKNRDSPSRPSSPAPAPSRLMRWPTSPYPRLDYLAQPQKYPPRPVCAVFGNEPFLRREAILCLRAAVLGGEEGDFSLSAFDGGESQFRDVYEALLTVAMFGGGKRLVVVEEADDFESRRRPKLEDYVARPSLRQGYLCSIWIRCLAIRGSTSRLLLPGCRSIAARRAARLTKWLADWAKQRHNIHLSAPSADLLVEMIGPEFGLLDQELAKLASMVDDGQKVTPELVSQSVGGWRAKTTWEMLDAALDGKVPEAMLQLDRLLSSGEQPVGLLARDSASLRRFGPPAWCVSGCRRLAAARSSRRRSRRP